MEASNYIYRFYRKWQTPPDLAPYRLRHGETDLCIFCSKDLTEKADQAVETYRNQIKNTIQHNPRFSTSLKPLRISSPYSIINQMIEKSRIAGVGPMAGVAGAVAEFVGRDLLPFTEELIIENGGDTFIKTTKDRTMLIYAGEDSPFSNKLRIKLRARNNPFGVCTSSAKIGHSLSFGKTDATIIIASSAVTADVFATAAANLTKTPDDIEKAIQITRKCTEISGGVVIIGDRIGAWGEVEFV